MLRLAVLAVGLMFCVACAGSEADVKPSDAGKGGDGAGACKPGTLETCQATATCKGSHLCQAKGTWSPCDCGWPSSGGSGGSGGTTASGGTAGTSSGGSVASGGTPPTSLDLHDVTVFNNPPNEADWAETTQITVVDFQQNGQDGVHVEFSKQDGADRWPDVTPPGWDGPLQYTLGMVEFINGHWVGSAAIQFWYGLPASGGNVALDNQVAKNWYYDSRWGELNGVQPKTGETIGIFVIAGNVRGVEDGSQSPAQERSNIVLMPFPDVNGAHYTFP